MLDGIVFNAECDGSCLLVIFWFMVILVGECIWFRGQDYEIVWTWYIVWFKWDWELA